MKKIHKIWFLLFEHLFLFFSITIAGSSIELSTSREGMHVISVSQTHFGYLTFSKLLEFLIRFCLLIYLGNKLH